MQACRLTLRPQTFSMQCVFTCLAMQRLVAQELRTSGEPSAGLIDLPKLLITHGLKS